MATDDDPILYAQDRNGTYRYIEDVDRRRMRVLLPSLRPTDEGAKRRAQEKTFIRTPTRGDVRMGRGGRHHDACPAGNRGVGLVGASRPFL